MISVVICTRNRARKLESALRCFALLPSREPWELVLVDNGSEDDTDSVIRSATLPAPGRVVAACEPRPGLSRARNRGLEHASGDLIAFTDDDCLVPDDYLLRIEECFRRAEIGFVGGRVALKDPRAAKLTTQMQSEPREFEPRSVIPGGMIHGANMVIRRACIEAVGGFDELLGAGTIFRAGEDADMLRRISLAGFAGSYEPALSVSHDHGRRSGAEADAHMRGYWRGRGASCAKLCLHPSGRPLYLRYWYWQLRRSRARQILTELFWGGAYVLTRAWCVIRGKAVEPRCARPAF